MVQPRSTCWKGPVCILAGITVLVASVGLVDGDVSAHAQESSAPAVSVTELMQAMIIPASNTIFNLPRDPPTDDVGWAIVRNSAVILAESGTLLMREGRAEDSEVWRATSRALAEAGEAALRAARARDADGISDAGNLLIDSCEMCHEKHRIR